jgi:gas vesicle protein
MEERGTSKSFLLGLLAGGLAGGAIALLYAPKSGREMRKDISQKKDKLIKDADRYYEDTKKRVDKMLHDGKKKAETLIHDAKAKAESITDGAGNLYTQSKEFVSDEAAKLKGAVQAGVDAYKDERKHTKSYH